MGVRRLFVAVEVPPAVHDAVDEALDPWRGTPGARWVPRERRHVTIRFLGAVASDAVDGVRRAVGTCAAAAAPVDSRLTGLGAFPSTRRARVIWAGVDDGAGRMADLGSALDRALAPGVRHEMRMGPRAFRPHLTVARCDPPAPLPDDYAATVVEPVEFRVASVVLFESVPGGRGPQRYQALEHAELAG
jgi:RNA 2',3'-cyclic 3'-phosphodiesterase